MAASTDIWIIQAALCLLFAQAVFGSSVTLIECRRHNAEQGMQFCKEAFHDTFEEHKVKFLTSPKRTGCCSSHFMKYCLEFSFTEAKCDPKEQKVAIMIADKVKESQEYINKAASYLGTLLCGDIKRENCGDRLLHHFDTAYKNITLMNGAPRIAAPSIFAASLAAMVGAFYARIWV